MMRHLRTSARWYRDPIVWLALGMALGLAGVLVGSVLTAFGA